MKNSRSILGSVTLAVCAACLPLKTSAQPVITEQPQSCTNIARATATFAVAATGTPPLVYQWQRDNNGSLDFSNLADATNATLLLTNVRASDAVNYRVIVTNVEGAARFS